MKCPVCNENLVQIIYGMPTPEAFEKASRRQRISPRALRRGRGRRDRGDAEIGATFTPRSHAGHISALRYTCQHMRRGG